MHEHRKRICLALANGTLDKRSAAHLHVAHRAECGLEDGRFCDCDCSIPGVFLRGNKPVTLYLDRDGRLVAQDPSGVRLRRRP